MTVKPLSTAEINEALLPLLQNLQNHLAKVLPNIVTSISVDNQDPDDLNDDENGMCDGACLTITHSNGTIFKILGSEWDSKKEVAYINIVKVDDGYTKAYRGTFIERAEVDGSVNLAAELLDWQEWLEEVVVNLVQTNRY